MSNGLLSICIPTHNFGSFLEETLESILPQMHSDTELILLDGASTDDTPEIGAKYAKKDARIQYHRREQKGGIDRDIALSVSLANNEYVWLFSSDDVMKPNALHRMYKEMASQEDVYLCGFTVCGLDIKQVYWDHPIFQLNASRSFDWSRPSEKKLFFEKAVTTTAFFSFMGSLIIRKKRWDETLLNESFYGSCWAHAARIFTMEPKGLRIRFIKESLLYKRGFNDSFAAQGIVHRISIPIDGYNRIADHFFKTSSIEAYHIRRTVVYELPLKAILISAKSQLKSKEEKKRLDQLVLKLYCDSSWLNSLRKAIYFAIPEWAIRSLCFIYRYRSFFKHFRVQKLKYMLRPVCK